MKGLAGKRRPVLERTCTVLASARSARICNKPGHDEAGMGATRLSDCVKKFVE